MILGMDWLEQWGAMICHWKQEWIQFEHKGETVTLQGVQQSEQKEIKYKSSLWIKWSNDTREMKYGLLQ